MNKEDLCVVTGASGRLGFPFCLELIKRGCKVRALYLNQDEIVTKLQENGCETMFCDVTDIDSVNKAFEGGTYVFHLAGVVSIESKLNDYIEKVNVGGTANVIEACLKQNIKRLIYTGSVHMLDPDNENGKTIYEPKRFSPDKVFGAYAVSKCRAGNLILDAVESRGLDAVIGLPSGIIGPYDYNGSNFGEVVAQVAEKKMRVYFKGKYDFVDVRDVSEALCDLADKGEKGEVYNISGNVVEIKDLMKFVTDEAGVREIKFKIPLFLVKWFAKFSEAIALRRKRTVTVTPYSIRVLQDNCNFSHEKLSRLTGYTPRPAGESLKDHTRFYLNNRKLKANIKSNKQLGLKKETGVV